jgi:hypothetical protein
LSILGGDRYDGVVLIGGFMGDCALLAEAPNKDDPIIPVTAKYRVKVTIDRNGLRDR